MALGNERFKEDIERLTARRVTVGERGRPQGWRKLKDEVYFTLTPIILLGMVSS